MRILALNYEYPPLGGGGGVIFKNLYDELSKRHHVTIVTSHYGSLPTHETRRNQEIHRVPVWRRSQLSTASMASMLTYPLSSWRCARKLLAKERFDVINSHFVVPTAPSGQALAGTLEVPHIVNVHGGDLYDPSKKMSPHRLLVVPHLVRALLNKADRVIAPSTDIAANARRIYRVDRQIDVIPLAIAPFELKEVSRSSLAIGEDRFVMATVGRLIARKGIDDLLRVVQDLDDPRDLLLVIGSGPAKKRLESLAVAFGIEDRVRFTGWVSEEEKSDLMRISNLYVSTSLHEGFGLVFLEAMHCGLPIVCYDRGGHTDFLADGKTGALVPLGKRHALVEAVRRLKTDRGTAQSCAAFNRERVKDFYIDRYAERHETLIDGAIRARRQAR